MRAIVLHAGLLLGLFLLQFILPEYHHANAARIMVYALLAMGYNVLFGYTGLMSLGHAMFFASGAYGAALVAHWLGYGPLAAFGCGASSWKYSAGTIDQALAPTTKAASVQNTAIPARRPRRAARLNARRDAPGDETGGFEPTGSGLLTGDCAGL